VVEDHSRFWSFSLTVYSNPDVRKECLELQDRHNIDVNLLLFCAFAGAVHGAVLPETSLREAADLVGGWHNDVVTNLREARRALKPFTTGSLSAASVAAALRNSVKAMELEAERLEQRMLEAWSQSRLGTWPRMQGTEAAAANICALFALGAGSAAAPELPRHLVVAAIAAAR